MALRAQLHKCWLFDMTIFSLVCRVANCDICGVGVCQLDLQDEESRDEFVPLAEYGTNLLAFAAKVRQWQPQAQLAWLSSTPMHFDMHLNANVNQCVSRHIPRNLPSHV